MRSYFFERYWNPFTFSVFKKGIHPENRSLKTLFYISTRRDSCLIRTRVGGSKIYVYYGLRYGIIVTSDNKQKINNIN